MRGYRKNHICCDSRDSHGSDKNIKRNKFVRCTWKKLYTKEQFLA